MSMKYSIAYGSSMTEILYSVQAHIDLGYKPIGGVSVLAYGTGVTFYQAMIKE